MVKSYYQSTYKTKEFLRPKLAKHKKFHNFLIKLDRTYSNITGFLHVLPDFYLIGAQKCGTSALYDYLVQHPCIHPCSTKEPRFFDKYFNRGINWYKTCYSYTLKKNIEQKIFHRKFLTGEATERYLEHPHVSKRIKKTTPNAKFIVLLRNPIDRAYSHYNMRYKSKKEKLSFENAIESEKNRTENEFKKMLDDENYYSKDYFHHSYLDRGIYIDKLKRWMEVFPKEQFLIIQSEEFLENSSKIYYNVLDFLKLDKWEPDSFTLYKKRKIIDDKISTDLRKYLLDFFEPHNEELFNLINKKFDWN